MKLYYSLASPYVRKVVVTAIEAGLDSEIERVAPLGNVWIGDGDAEVSGNNPLGKIPTLITRDGDALVDSTCLKPNCCRPRGLRVGAFLTYKQWRKALWTQ